MKFRDYYEVMGVARDASQEVIKKAYRRLARKYHPDVSKEADAEAKFKQLQEAYEVLKDPEKRAAYNQLGENWRAGQDFRPPPDWGKGFEFSRGRPGRGPRDEGGAEFSDFFSELFGARSPFGRARSSGGPQFSAAGQDHMARVEIDLEDAYRGGARTIELRAPELAPDGQLRVKPRTLRVSIPAGVTERPADPSRGPGEPGDRRRPIGRSLPRDQCPPARALHVERPRRHSRAACGSLGSGARGARIRPDPGRPGGHEASRGCSRRTEAAPARARAAGPDARRPVRFAQNRAAARHPEGARALRANEARSAVRSTQRPGCRHPGLINRRSSRSAGRSARSARRRTRRSAASAGRLERHCAR